MCVYTFGLTSTWMNNNNVTYKLLKIHILVFVIKQMHLLKRGLIIVNHTKYTIICDFLI